MKERAEELEGYVYTKDMPFNPFGCGRYKYCEGGRWEGKSAGFRLISSAKLCGCSGVLGISEGVLGEIRDRLRWDKEKISGFSMMLVLIRCGIANTKD